jgi:hypothetical protein
VNNIIFFHHAIIISTVAIRMKAKPEKPGRSVHILRFFMNLHFYSNKLHLVSEIYFSAKKKTLQPFQKIETVSSQEGCCTAGLNPAGYVKL